MGENNIQEVKVTVNPENTFGSPVPVLNLVFATLCFCFWANTMGFFTDGAVLAIGVLRRGFYRSRRISSDHASRFKICMQM